MVLINPYIHFNRNAEEAFTFYKSVFGGKGFKRNIKGKAKDDRSYIGIRSV
jgi:uncharacterized glyoxalase superfamily protein PhnB